MRPAELSLKVTHHCSCSFFFGIVAGVCKKFRRTGWICFLFTETLRYARGKKLMTSFWGEWDCVETEWRDREKKVKGLWKTRPFEKLGVSTVLGFVLMDLFFFTPKVFKTRFGMILIVIAANKTSFQNWIHKLFTLKVKMKKKKKNSFT